MPENLHGTTLTRFFVGSAYKVRTANFVQCEFNVNSNEWVNEFYQCIGNNPRIFSMISIQFLVFCGVFMEGAKWITRCRLNKIKDGWKLSGCLLTQKKKDMGSIRSWTYFYKLFVEDKRQTEKDEQDEQDEQDEGNSSMFFWNLEILPGSYSPPFCLRIPNFLRHVTSRNQGDYGRSYSRNSGEEERGPWKRGCNRRSLNVSLTEFGKKYLNQFWLVKGWWIFLLLTFYDWF